MIVLKVSPNSVSCDSKVGISVSDIFKEVGVHTVLIVIKKWVHTTKIIILNVGSYALNCHSKGYYI